MLLLFGVLSKISFITTSPRPSFGMFMVFAIMRCYIPVAFVGMQGHIVVYSYIHTES
jgi:hypothetical protein